MFSRPNKHDSSYLIADYIEFQCLMSGKAVSSYDLRALLSMSDDEDNNDGIDSSDDWSIDCLNEAVGICNSRFIVCGERYPFRADGNSLSMIAEPLWYQDIYVFLLFATRLNMNTQKVQGGEDATKLFELICSEVARGYLGGKAQSKVFGTGVVGGFQQKVEKMLSDLHLPALYRQPAGSTGHQRDAHVDVVAWIPFSDNKDSQLIALGQCKTGTSWEGMIGELDPKDFFCCFTTIPPYADVIKTFFLTESFGDYKWEERCRKAGILFDRTRIMEFLPNDFDSSLLERIKKWNTAAIDNERKNFD